MERFIIGVAVAILIVSAVLPVAIDQFEATDTSTWSTELQNLWPLIPLFAILAIVLLFVKRRNSGSGGF